MLPCLSWVLCLDPRIHAFVSSEGTSVRPRPLSLSQARLKAQGLLPPAIKPIPFLIPQIQASVPPLLPFCHSIRGLSPGRVKRRLLNTRHSQKQHYHNPNRKIKHDVCQSRKTHKKWHTSAPSSVTAKH